MKTSKLIALALVSVASLAVTGSTQAGLTAYYSLNGNVNDSGPSGYTGTINGTQAYGGGLNQDLSFKFNGNTNIATTTTDNLGIYNGSFTVDAEVNFSNPTGGDQSVFGTTNGGQDVGLHLI